MKNSEKKMYVKKIYCLTIKNKKTDEVKYFLFFSKKAELCIMAAVFILYHVGCIRAILPSIIFKDHREGKSIYIDTTIGLYPNVIDVPDILKQAKQ